MKIFGIEIRRAGALNSQPSTTNSSAALSAAELAGIFRIAEDTAWFRAVLQEIDRLERETIEESRRVVGDTNKCINAVGGGEALALLKSRLCALREQAVKGREDAPSARTPNIQRPTPNAQ